MFGRLDAVAGEAKAGGGRTAPWLEALRAGAPITAPAVAVVAHPDDEVVGFGLRLAALQNLTLAHATDGAPEDMGDARRAGFATREAYAHARAGELDACLAALGAAPRRLALGVQDQTAVFHLAEMVAALQEPLAGAALVLTHAYEGGHPDHDACAFAVQLACERLAAEGRPAPVRLAFAEYHTDAAGRLAFGRSADFKYVHFGGGLPPLLFDLAQDPEELNNVANDPAYLPVRLEFAEYHKDAAGRLAFCFWPDPASPAVSPEAGPELVARKAAAMACHRSQGRITTWFDPAAEVYRAAPVYDFTGPPPSGAAIYDDWGWAITSARWRTVAAAALRTAS